MEFSKVRSLPDSVGEDVLKFVNESNARDAFEACTLPNVWSKMNESCVHEGIARLYPDIRPVFLVAYKLIKDKYQNG